MYYLFMSTMDNKCFKVSMDRNPTLYVNVFPGHFTTGNIHSNYFIDVSELKFNTYVAKNVAQELARPYLTSVVVDTIVCVEASEVIGVYLAEELIQYGAGVINPGGNIYIVTPHKDVNGNFIFPDNMKNWINQKSVILLATTISSGTTAKRAMECIDYYGGKLAGISSLFLTSQDVMDTKVNALFTSADIPGYKVFSANECEMCKSGQPLDAIINSEGYTKLR